MKHDTFLNARALEWQSFCVAKPTGLVNLSAPKVNLNLALDLIGTRPDLLRFPYPKLQSREVLNRALKLQRFDF